MTPEINAFIDLLKQYRHQCRLLLLSETNKRQALLSHDCSEITSMMQSQQAAIMKLNSLELRRQELQADAGFSAMTAEGILSLLGEESEEKAILGGLLGDLRNIAEELAENNRVSLNMAKDHLKMLSQLSQNTAPGDAKTYRGSVMPGFASRSSFSETI
ncbi:flagellar export chaperone FlgN [Acidaminobacterium chupaoyuni]